MKCSIEQKREAIRNYVNNIVDQEFYTVVFVKKTTGEVRKMQCRQNVHKWCKSVPDRSGEFDMRYVFVDEGTRGAWPATYAFEYGEGYEEWKQP